jgi:hypothetical protein
MQLTQLSYNAGSPLRQGGDGRENQRSISNETALERSMSFTILRDSAL